MKYLLISKVESQTKTHCIQMDIYVLYKKLLFISTSSPNEKLTLLIIYTNLKR